MGMRFGSNYLNKEDNMVTYNDISFKDPNPNPDPSNFKVKKLKVTEIS